MLVGLGHAVEDEVQKVVINVIGVQQGTDLILGLLTGVCCAVKGIFKYLKGGDLKLYGDREDFLKK